MKTKIGEQGQHYISFEDGEYLTSESGKVYKFLGDTEEPRDFIYHAKVLDGNKEIFIKFAYYNSDGKENQYIYSLSRENRFRFFYPYIEHVWDSFLGTDPIGQKIYAVCLEYIEGQDLEKDYKHHMKLVQEGKMTIEALEQRMFRHMMQLLTAVSYYMNYAPEAYLHRDLKPLNIMISKKDDSVVIVDFDCAHNEGSKGTELGKINCDLGASRGYTPPQILIGKTDKISDIYSIGRIFCYWLIGKNYFKEDELKDVEDGNREIFRPKYCQDLKIGYGLDETRFKERYRQPKYEKLHNIIRRMCGNPATGECYEDILDVIEDMKEFLWEYCGKSVKKREELLQSAYKSLLRKEYRSTKGEPIVAYRNLWKEDGLRGGPLLEYTMRDILNERKEVVMKIYHIKGVVYYIPMFGKSEVIRERIGSDYEIRCGDIFTIGNLKIQFEIK